MRNLTMQRFDWKITGLLVAAITFAVPQTASADQCFNDDVIVIGSIGVGIDSVCNQNFGFDTIILKENNLRILFDDTSTSASFPKNDWRLVANDTSNGGAEFFAIEDASAGRRVFQVTAGARTNALFVSSNSRIGIGTNTPAVDIDIKTGNTPTVRLQQDGTSGFTPQTWDLAGNEANFFIRDATNGSTLPFRIQPGAPTNSISIKNDGKVGLGTNSATASLHVNNSTSGTSPVVRIEDANNVATDQPRFELASPLIAGNSPAGQVWSVKSNSIGQFAIDHVASSGAELVIDDDLANIGTVTVGRNLNVVGALTKGSGTFKIDHPLYPEDKFLSHSFVESPEMMNVYNGNIELDENGEASVVLPEWFQSLNRDFRYQLTAIGASAPGLHVAEEVSNNHFKVSGGVANGRVSWQVTGVRQDAFAKANPVVVEQDKPADERGFYLHPEAFGFSQTKSLQAAHTNDHVVDK